MNLILFPWYGYHTIIFPIAIVIVMGWILSSVYNQKYKQFVIAKRIMTVLMVVELFSSFIDIWEFINVDFYKREFPGFVVFLKECAFAICIWLGLKYMERSIADPNQSAANTKTVHTPTSVESYTQPASTDSEPMKSSSILLEDAINQIEAKGSSLEMDQESTQETDPKSETEKSASSYDLRSWVVETSEKE